MPQRSQTEDLFIFSPYFNLFKARVVSSAQVVLEAINSQEPKLYTSSRTYFFAIASWESRAIPQIYSTTCPDSKMPCAICGMVIW